MKGKRLAAITAVIYIVFLVACSASWLADFQFQELISKVTKTVSLEEGVFKRNIGELTVILHDGETAKLADFTELRSADFCGSGNVEEIRQWAAQNPQVSVLYELRLPNGLNVDNQAQSLDFSGINSSNLSDYSQLLAHFTQVNRVELGSAADSPTPLSPQELLSLMDEHPELEFSYSFSVAGNPATLADESINLSRIGSVQLDEVLSYLLCMKKLSSVELGDENICTLSWDEIARLQQTCPQAVINYSFTLYDNNFNLSDETVNLSHVPVNDGGAAVKAALPCMKECKTLDMDSCGLSNEEMLAIREAFPEVDVIWRVWFGEYMYYSVRTDATRILASKSSDAGSVTDADVPALSCCTKVKYMDVGHNSGLTDISFVSSMPDLEVFIAATNELMYDISPLADCPKLEYLEIFSTCVMDLSPLANATELRHLNIYNCPYLTDISPLNGLTELERLWIGDITPVPAEQLEQLAAVATNCTICKLPGQPTENNWRAISYDPNTGVEVRVPRYFQLRAQLGYDYSQFSFYWLDPLCGLEAPPHLAGVYTLPPEGEDADDYDPETFKEIADYYYKYNPEALKY